MKKTIWIILFLIIAMTAAAASASFDKDNCVYEPDITDEDHIIRTCWFYDSDGEKAIDPESGYAGKTEVYEHLINVDGRYELVRVEYLDPDGNLMPGPDGYAGMTAEYDLYRGGPVCRDWYTISDPNNNICGYTYRYYDADKNPVMIHNFDSGFRYRDKNGDGEVQMVPGGCETDDFRFAVFSTEMAWTEEGFVQKSSFYDADGKPLQGKDLYAAYEKVIFENGGGEERYYGPDGELINSPAGYALAVETYNEDERESFLRYYDANRQPAANAELGDVHAIHEFHGPIMRQVLRTDYLDVNDDPVNNSSGYSTVIREYLPYIPPSETVPMGLESLFPINTTYLDKDGKTVEVKTPY